MMVDRSRQGKLAPQKLTIKIVAVREAADRVNKSSAEIPSYDTEAALVPEGGSSRGC